MKRLVTAAAVAAGSLLFGVIALAQAPIVQGADHTEGERIYRERCASCHENPAEPRVPSLATLRTVGARPISHALTNGKMVAMAAGLTPAQIDAVVGYLSATADVDNSWIARNTCPADRMAIDVAAAPTIAGFGVQGLRNNRSLTAAQAGLTRADMSKLQLKWSLGFPGAATMRSQPVVIGNTMFIGIVDPGQVFAFDISGTPCVKWAYEHPVSLRSSLGTGKLPDGRTVIVFGDNAAHVQVLDARTGQLIWRTSVRVTTVSSTTGQPVIYKDRIYASISNGELNMGAKEDYECCQAHGAVVALEAATGAMVWTFHTMPDAQKTQVSRVGTQQWGPAGAPIWTTPAIDEERGVLYVGTGQNTSGPANDVSDAILAVNLADGTLRWKFQATANDIFLTGCNATSTGANCPGPTSLNADYDFGASVVIAERPGGRDIILAGQKSGELWALDPDAGGTLLWKRTLGPGGPVGGIHWGMAYDGQNVFASTNKPAAANAPPQDRPGLFSLNAETGAVNWSYYNTPDCTGDRQQRFPRCATSTGMSAATLLVDGAVVQGANDGFVRIFDSADGKLLFAYDTARSFETVNGVAAKGAAIDNANIIAAGGLLLVQSGYGLFGAPGNVLLGFAPAD